MHRTINRIATVFAIGALCLVATPPAHADTAQPDVWIDGDPAAGAAVASDHALATDAAWRVLEAGGRAADAAIAAAMVLTVTMPEAASLAAGGAALRYDAKVRHITAYVGREISSRAVARDWNDKGRGDTVKTLDGGRAVGVPTLLQMLGRLHAEGGRLDWSDLTGAAENLARGGIRLSAEAAAHLSRVYLPPFGGVEAIFRPDGKRLVKAGDVIRNPDLGDVLAAIGRDGSDVLAGGIVGKSIVRSVADTQRRPAVLTLDELAVAAPTVAPPQCIVIAGAALCSTPGPTAGVAVLETAALFQATSPRRPTAFDWAHLMAQAHRLASVDARRYLADPRRWPDMTSTLLTPRQIARRAKGIRPDADRGLPGPARIAGAPKGLETPAIRARTPPTASVVVVDAGGDAVALSISLTKPFGSGLAARGIVLNAAISAFDPPSTRAGFAPANGIAPETRPRLDIAPVMALDGGRQLVLAAAGAGGDDAPAFLAKAAVAALAFGKSAAAAVAAPNVASSGRSTELESHSPAERLELALRDIGHKTQVKPLYSGLVMIRRNKSGQIEAAADPRGQGTAQSRPAGTQRPLDSSKRGS